MAHSSGIGTIVGLGIAGAGIWYLGDIFGWWGTAAPTATATTPVAGIVPATTPMPTTAPPATYVMNGTPAPSANGSLKASFTINGTTQNIAVIPNGDAYNDAGQDITAALAAIGITPAQLYSMMSAAYVAPATPSASSTAAAGSTATTPAPATGRGAFFTGAGAVSPIGIRRPIATVGRGMAGRTMVGSNNGNYVRRGG